MRQSNATHVRMVNASWDTEGSYSCEISTQTLTTVKMDKDIRLYGK